jgi:DivIVA domain-containing protein
MALTPEDVVNKRFQPTKFREGYDQDEVDDFLDEVVVELRRLNQENEELKQRLVASESRIGELQRNAASEQTQAIAAPAPAPVAAPVAPQPAPSSVDDTESTNNLLQLARRLHEEHVREGVEKRDALIADGHATAARVVAEA